MEDIICTEFGGSDIIDITPSEFVYEGLDEIEEGYRKWSWIYGKSPKFSLTAENHTLNVVNGKTNVDCNVSPVAFSSTLSNILLSSDDQALVQLGNIVQKIV